MLDPVRGLEALPTKLAIHLLLRHLPLDERAIEDEELRVVLDQFQGHLVVECLVTQLLVLLRDARYEEEILQAHFIALFKLQQAVV